MRSGCYLSQIFSCLLSPPGLEPQAGGDAWDDLADLCVVHHRTSEHTGPETSTAMPEIPVIMWRECAQDFSDTQPHAQCTTPHCLHPDDQPWVFYCILFPIPTGFVTRAQCSLRRYYLRKVLPNFLFARGCEVSLQEMH